MFVLRAGRTRPAQQAQLQTPQGPYDNSSDYVSGTGKNPMGSGKGPILGPNRDCLGGWAAGIENGESRMKPSGILPLIFALINDRPPKLSDIMPRRIKSAVQRIGKFYEEREAKSAETDSRIDKWNTDHIGKSRPVRRAEARRDAFIAMTKAYRSEPRRIRRSMAFDKLRNERKAVNAS